MANSEFGRLADTIEDYRRQRDLCLVNRNTAGVNAYQDRIDHTVTRNLDIIITALRDADARADDGK